MANEPNTSAAPITGAAAPTPAAPAPAADSGATAPAAPSANTTPSAPVETGSNSVTSFLDGGAAPVVPEQKPAADINPTPSSDSATQKSVEAPTTAEPAKTPTTPNTDATGDKQPDAQKDQGSKSVEPAALPVYEAWKLPDNVKLNETQATDFTKLLGELQNTSKAEQAVMQKFGQELVDRHVAAVNETVNSVHEAYSNAWQKQTDGWREAFINDPEIGGKRQETTIRLANEFIDTHGGSPENKAAFREVMKNTGLGVHPEVLRLLANAMNRYREGKPVPANPPRTTPASKPSKWYGKKTG